MAVDVSGGLLHSWSFPNSRRKLKQHWKIELEIGGAIIKCCMFPARKLPTLGWSHTHLVVSESFDMNGGSEPFARAGEFRSGALPPRRGLAGQRKPQGARGRLCATWWSWSPRPDELTVGTSAVPRVVQRMWPAAASPSMSFVDNRGSVLISVSPASPARELLLRRELPKV